MHSEGADLIDVGGESTRPGADPVSEEEETDRILPVITRLVSKGVPVSVDTSKPEVALRALEAGASVINDVTGFRDPEMVDAAARTGAGVIVMHMRGDPRTMQDEPKYGDVVSEIRAYLVGRALQLEAAGVRPEAIVIDPGFGFGKTTRHNLELFSRLEELSRAGYPVMVGLSRKSTLGAITGEPDPKRRDTQTAIATSLAFERGARVFRVHDVAKSRDALRIAAAIVDPQQWEKWQQD